MSSAYQGDINGMVRLENSIKARRNMVHIYYRYKEMPTSQVVLGQEDSMQQERKRTPPKYINAL